MNDLLSLMGLKSRKTKGSKMTEFNFPPLWEGKLRNGNKAMVIHYRPMSMRPIIVLVNEDSTAIHLTSTGKMYRNENHPYDLMDFPLNFEEIITDRVRIGHYQTVQNIVSLMLEESLVLLADDEIKQMKGIQLCVQRIKKHFPQVKKVEEQTSRWVIQTRDNRWVSFSNGYTDLYHRIIVFDNENAALAYASQFNKTHRTKVHRVMRTDELSSSITDNLMM